MKKVYIVCEPVRKVAGEVLGSIDLSPAAEWGEPVVLLPFTQSLLNPASTIDTLHEKLATFSDQDYLVPIGDPVLMCAATAVASFINYGRVKLLKWDRILKKYYPIQLDIERTYGEHHVSRAGRLSSNPNPAPVSS